MRRIRLSRGSFPGFCSARSQPTRPALPGFASALERETSAVFVFSSSPPGTARERKSQSLWKAAQRPLGCSPKLWHQLLPRMPPGHTWAGTLKTIRKNGQKFFRYKRHPRPRAQLAVGSANILLLTTLQIRKAPPPPSWWWWRSRCSYLFSTLYSSEFPELSTLCARKALCKLCKKKIANYAKV